MKTDFEAWNDELNGVRERSSWPLVAVCAFIALVAAWGICR